MKLANLRPQVGAILVVDDEPDIVESLKDVLEAHLGQVKVLTAPSGKAGLALLKKEAVDLIISDYRMPGMDGLEFLTKCRETSPNTPRILITAYPELDAAVRAINEAQIQNFLTKPIMPEALMQAVNAALVKGRAGLAAR
jgi:DNA-binding NtrC family response regulator